MGRTSARHSLNDNAPAAAGRNLVLNFAPEGGKPPYEYRNSRRAPGPPPQAKPPDERDAIIFVPGLGHDQETQSIDVIGARLIHALEAHAATGKAAFSLSEGKEEGFHGGQIKTRTATISRRDGEQSRPVIDLYGFDYRRALIGRHEQQRPIVQGLSIARLLAANFRRVFTRRPSKTRAQWMQTVYAWVFFVLLAFYMILLLVTAVGTALKPAWDRLSAPPAAEQSKTGQDAKQRAQQQQQQPQQQQQQQQQAAAPDAAAPAPPAAQPNWARRALSAAWGGIRSAGSRVWRSWLDVLQAAVIFVAALGLFTKANLKETLARVSTELTCATRYLATGERGGTIAGQFTSLLNYIEEREAAAGITYRRIHVIGFSFGTIVTLDALFPRGAPDQRIRHVHTLVTIGCPFDFIRTYWPRYFEGRNGWDEAPRAWINIYSPADVLGSNFLDDGAAGGKVSRGVKVDGKEKERDPTANVRFGQSLSLEDYSYWEQLTLAGFRAHDCYWERGQAHDNACFGDVVKNLYADDRVLS